MGSLFLAVLFVPMIAQLRAHQRTTRAVRAQRARSAVDAIARLLAAEPSELGAAFGVSDAEIRAWLLQGVPRGSHALVARTLKSASALRRELSAPTARRLLELRAHARAEASAAAAALEPLKREARTGYSGVRIAVRMRI